MRTVETYRYGTVLINGSRNELTEFAIDLRQAGYGVGRPNAAVLCVDDVSEDELHHLSEESLRRGCFVESTRGCHAVIEDLRIKKAEKSDLEVKTWYFAENLEDSYPFVYVRSMTMQAMPTRVTADDDDDDNDDDEDYDGEEVVVVGMDLVDADGSMPRYHDADAREVKEYGLRLATEEDFEERDLPAPVEIKLRKQREAAAGEPDKDAIENFGGELL
jgi:hypothetical protein